MSDPRQTMQHRLVGAVVIFALIFLVSLLLPAPGPEQQPEGALVIPLHPPEVVSPLTTAEHDRRDQQAPVTEDDSPTQQPAPAPQPEMPPAAPARAEAPAPKAEPEPERSAAPEQPAERPAPTAQQPPPAARGGWWVQAAAYRQEEMARLGAQRLDDAGIATRLRQADVGGAPVWRLQAGPFPTRDDAEVWGKVIEEKGFAGARVFHDE